MNMTKTVARWLGARHTWVVALAALGAAPAAWADVMPEGARLWMVHQANTCWDHVPGHTETTCAASAEFGPGGGIPMQTYTWGTNWTSSFAQAGADSVHSFLGGSDTGFLYVSMRDTYTVHGAAPGSFAVTARLSAEGVASSVWYVGKHWLYNPSVELEIGTFDTNASSDVHEQFRVQPFSEATTALWVGPITIGPHLSVPFEVSTSYTKAVQSGDVFELGFGINTSGVVGDVDMRNSGLISFDLPEGVWITSQNGAVFGLPVPEPSTPALLAAGLLALFLARRVSARDR